MQQYPQLSIFDLSCTRRFDLLGTRSPEARISIPGEQHLKKYVLYSNAILVVVTGGIKLGIAMARFKNTERLPVLSL